MEYLRQYSELAIKHGLRRHLDGARVFNAAVALGVSVRDICQYFDTVSICLSKGLACPVGSILVGDTETIRSARRWRKMLGGGMRQAGILAAAGLYALRNNVQRLQEDHDHASRVAAGLAELSSFSLRETPQTNMVMLAPDMDIAALQEHLLAENIKMSGPRWVFHHDISSGDVERLLAVCQRFA